MKAVLISTKPRWCELIASGKKTVEVRKTRPKIDTPFKVYIHETKGKLRWCNKCQDPNCERPYPGCACFEGLGKVIGEFVCDRIVQFENSVYDEALLETRQNSCVPLGELLVYIGCNDYGYGWHISDLVIYDKPRELGEFSKYGFGHPVPLKRPPQSWMYIESEDNK